MLRSSKDKGLNVGKEFGDLADTRASDPVTILPRFGAKKGAELPSQSADIAQRATTNKIVENYFNKNFAATPTAQSQSPNFADQKQDLELLQPPKER